MNKKTQNTRKGRPSKEENNIKYIYKVDANIIKDECIINIQKKNKGKFILATNQFDTNILPDNQILSTYKEQSGTESGFKFIKNKSFQLDSIYVKKHERINSLMMIMTLCLLIHSFAQLKLREKLEENNDTIPSQVNKPTNKHTMNLIYRLFHGVNILKIKVNGQMNYLVLNLERPLF